MRLFELRNFQDFVMYLFPALAAVVLFAIGLAFSHFRSEDSAEREHKIIERYVSGIEGRNAPFPLIVYLIIGGTVIWCILYIVLTGALGRKI